MACGSVFLNDGKALETEVDGVVCRGFIGAPDKCNDQQDTYNDGRDAGDQFSLEPRAAILCDACRIGIKDDGVRYHCSTCDELSTGEFDLCEECWASSDTWRKHFVEDKHVVVVVSPSRIGYPNTVYNCFARSLRSALLLWRERPLFGVGVHKEGAGIVGYKWTSYWDIYLSSRALQSWIITTARIPPGSRIAILGENSVAWIVSFFGSSFAGCVTAPISPKVSNEAVIEGLVNSDVTAIFCDSSHFDMIHHIISRRSMESATCQGSFPLFRWLVVLESVPPSPCLKQVLAQNCIHYTSLNEAIEQSNAAPIWPRIVPREWSSAGTIVFTSGSEGMMKGAVIPDRNLNMHVRTVDAPPTGVQLLYMPLAYSAQLFLTLTVMSSGGKLGLFSGDLATFFQEVSILGPTDLQAPPFIWSSLYSKFNAQMAISTNSTEIEEVKRTTMISFRKLLGPRIVRISTGGAPTPDVVLNWMKECFYPINVREGYGTTECGSIAVDGRIRFNVQVRLEDVPDLGYFKTDKPPRGLLWVKTPEMYIGYLGNTASNQDNFSSDGFFCTGDIVELKSETMQIKVIDRAKFCCKLSQGFWVSPEKLEKIYSTSKLVESVFVHVSSFLPCVLAVVVPNFHVLAKHAEAQGLQINMDDNSFLCSDPRMVKLISDDFKVIAGSLSLPSHEIPGGLLLDSKSWTGDNSLFLPSLKLNRRALTSKYSEKLMLQYNTQCRIEGAIQSAHSLLVSELNISNPSPTVPIRSFGLNSIQAIRLATILNKTLPFHVAPHALLSEHVTLNDLALGSSLSTPDVTVSELQHDTTLTESITTFNRSAEVVVTHTCCFLTGCTGFLGVHILAQLVSSGCEKVFCLVHDTSSSRPQEALKESLLKYSVQIPADTILERVYCISGDLGKPYFGLSEKVWYDIATSATLIIHNGATVSSIRPYSFLRRPNVIGTVECIKLAASQTKKRLVYISSLSAFSSSEMATKAPILELPLETDIRPGLLNMTPYGLTKRVSEILIQKARATGLEAIVLRIGTISGHSITGALNPTDTINRFLKSTMQLQKIPNPSAEIDRLASLAPVDWVAAVVAALSLLPGIPDANTYHIVGPPIPLLEHLQEAYSLHTYGKGRLEVVTNEEWMQAIHSDYNCALWPLRLMLHQLGGIPFRDERNLVDQSALAAILCEHPPPVVTQRTISQYLEKLC